MSSHSVGTPETIDAVPITMLSEAVLDVHKHLSINKSVLLPLSLVSRQMAETLYLNNYEVNKILMKYLEMWQQNPSSSSIPLVQYLQIFPDSYHGIVRSFFIDKGITYDQYFLFVCTFLFFQTHHIIQVMLSVSHIYSNVFITRSQINDFFRCYNLSEEPYHDLISVLKEASSGTTTTTLPKDSYFIKDFIGYFEHSLHFSGFLFSFQYIIIHTSMTQRMFSEIKRKIHLYSHTYCNNNNNNNNNNRNRSSLSNDSMNSCSIAHNNNNISNNVIVPKEPFCSKLYRKLFTNVPPPYHYDFSPPNANDHSFETMVLLVRQNISPDLRSSSCAKEVLNSSRYKKTTSSNNRSISRRTNSLLNLANSKSVIYVKPSQDGSQLQAVVKKK